MGFSRRIVAGQDVLSEDIRKFLGDHLAERIKSGFGVTGAGGLDVSVAAGTAYVKAKSDSDFDQLYKVVSGASESLTMADNKTNYIYLHCDNGSNYLTVSDSNTVPDAAILISTVVTANGSIVSITNVPAVTSTLGATTGIIVAWHGPLSSIPNGWYLCDGNNGTPNLLGRCLKSIDTTEDPGTTGGAPTHPHTLTYDYNGRGGTNTMASASSWPPYYEVAFIMKG